MPSLLSHQPPQENRPHKTSQSTRPCLMISIMILVTVRELVKEQSTTVQLLMVIPIEVTQETLALLETLRQM